MCGTILKVGFIVIVAIGTAATAVSMFTPGWQRSENAKGPSMGIISYNCGTENDQANVNECKDWWNNKEPWEKAVIAFMILALIFEIFILGWAIVSFFAFCCPSIFAPLPVLCGMATVFLIIAIAIYGAKNHDKIGIVQEMSQPHDMNQIGYSFWIGVFATIVMALSTIIGCVITVSMKEIPE
uniref:Lipoma HMGIC fusion partner-like 2 protein n=1 Tax=Steinernema glaseri TaxID=37863 RepID=A0A1I7YZF2_9BILA